MSVLRNQFSHSHICITLQAASRFTRKEKGEDWCWMCKLCHVCKQSRDFRFCKKKNNWKKEKHERRKWKKKSELMINDIPKICIRLLTVGKLLANPAITRNTFWPNRNCVGNLSFDRSDHCIEFNLVISQNKCKRDQVCSLC